jgi:hypothetical protein
MTNNDAGREAMDARSKFEAFMRGEPHCYDESDLRKLPDGTYQLNTVQIGWTCWNAAAPSPSAQTAENKTWCACIDGCGLCKPQSRASAHTAESGETDASVIVSKSLLETLAAYRYSHYVQEAAKLESDHKPIKAARVRVSAMNLEKELQSALQSRPAAPIESGVEPFEWMPMRDFETLTVAVEDEDDGGLPDGVETTLLREGVEGTPPSKFPPMVPLYTRPAAPIESGVEKWIAEHQFEDEFEEEGPAKLIVRVDQLKEFLSGFRLVKAEPAPAVLDGLCVEQEPKYSVRGDCIFNRASGEPIPADEPVFIFRARDVHALDALIAYATALPDGEHKDAVRRRCVNFGVFAERHLERMKEPDTAKAALSQSSGGRRE